MDFNSVPKLTQLSQYHVHIGWDNLLEFIKQEQEEGGLNIDPDFQRPHVWDEERKTKYIEHVLGGGTSGIELYLNHPGYMDGSADGPYELVDGKQRLNAIMGFMTNEVKAFGHYHKEFTGKLRMHARVVWYVNDLQTREQVLRWYLEMNEGHVAHTKEQLEMVEKMLETEKKG